MSEELLYNSGRPRRTRSSMTSAVTPVNSNPYKKPTYLVGKSNNATPEDSPDEAPPGDVTPSTPSVRGRRKPGRPFGSVTKNKSTPATPAQTPRGGGRRRGRGRGGNGSARSVETPTAPPPSTTSRKRGSTSTPSTWSSKSRPECVANRNDRRSTGSNAKNKKKRRGYNSTDYHYGSDFESDTIESEAEEPVPSESESVEDAVEDDMPLDEPLESDSDLSIGSARLQGLPSIPVPIWLDPEANVEELEIPRSSDDLLLTRSLLIDAIAIYEPLRRFSNLVRLSPFRFEDFCAALTSEDQSALLAEIHIQLLKALMREDDVTGTTYGPNECKDSMQSVLFFADNMTWAECLRAYFESDPTWTEIYDTLTSVEYPFCGPEIRIQVLAWLVDVFMVSNGVRDFLALEGKISHEDYCRCCNRLGELICCETCPAVFHLGCIKLRSEEEDPPDDWKCPVCEHHELLGVTDCVSEIERAGLLLRHETLGYDRHGRKYWFLVRRILVESEDKTEVWYYSTRLQVEELLFRLDSENYEKTLVENILYQKEEIFRQMGVTESVTQKMNANHRKTYLDLENAFLTRILEERELIKGQEAAEKLRIEEQARVSIRKQLEEKQRIEEDERQKKEDEKRRIREERLAKRNQIKLKQRLGKIGDMDESLEQFLLNEESKDSFTDDLSTRDEQTENSDDSKPGSSESKPVLENGNLLEGELKFHEAETQRIVPEDMPPVLEPEGKIEDVKMEVDEVKPAVEVKIEPKDIEPLVKTSILPRIAAKSKSLNLEVDSEERVTRLRSTGLYKLGQEGNFKNYVNRYSTDPLALSKNQHAEERDRRRVLSHKFSLTQASECKWSGPTQGPRTTIVSTLRQTLLNMEVAIPTTLMHCNWILMRKAWIAGVSGCGSAKEFSKALITFAACLRPSCFNPIWSEGTGHVKLSRTSSILKEIRKKNEKADKKFRDDEEDRLKLLPQFVKYSLPPKHQVWKQKGEEFRTHGNWGWIWLSNFRPAKSNDSRKLGLLGGPYKHVIQVKGNAGKVKTMMIAPEVYTKLMARRSVPPMDHKEVDLPGQVTPSEEPADSHDIQGVAESVLHSLVNDVIQDREVPTLTSLVKTEVKAEPGIKAESHATCQLKSEPGTESIRVKAVVPSTPTSDEQVKGEKPETTTSTTSPSRKFRTELINVSLGITSANRILYPRIAHAVKSLDSLLARRTRLQSEEEANLLKEYGAEMIESTKGPPPVLDQSPIVIPVDATFPLGGAYALPCFSYECRKAAMDGKPNFESKCYSPMCRLKSVIMATRRRKVERERLAEFEEKRKAREEIENKRSYNQANTDEKVHLKKLPEQLKKDRDLVKYPLTSKFYYHSTKRPSYLVLPQHELSKLARSGGRTFTPSGFAANPRPNTWLWPYPSGRPFFKTTWQYRTVHTTNLHAAAFNLRLLYACIRWDDIQMKPLNPEGKSQITTDMEVITSEILNHRIVGRFLEIYQYLRRRHVVPIDAPKTIMRDVTPSRSGLRKRKRAESPDNTEPVVREEWVDEDKFEVWEIRLYGEKLEKKCDKRPEPPANSTRTKTGITLRIPDKWDPSPKEPKEKETPPPTTKFLPVSALMRPLKNEVIEPELSPQRIVHISKRDNHAKITSNPNKVPTPTASQQVLQLTAAAAAAAANQGLPPGSSPATKAIALTQTTSPNGRKFFVTKPTMTVGARPQTPTVIGLKEIPKTGILKKPVLASPSAVGVGPTQNLAPSPLINSAASPGISSVAHQQVAVPGGGTKVTQYNQKVQVLRSEDGRVHVSGLLPGQQAFQSPDGKVHVVCAAPTGDANGMMTASSATATKLRAEGGGLLMPNLSAPAVSQPRVNISNPAIRTVISTAPSPSSPGGTALVRPTEVKKPGIMKSAMPPHIITVKRTAEDLKDSPLHLRTVKGVIECRYSNVTRNANGQDQIFLGPGLPIIQLLPPRAPGVASPVLPAEPPPLQQTQPFPSTLSVPASLAPVAAPSLVQQPAVQAQSPTVSVPVQAAPSLLGTGSRIVYTEGNRSFILNTAGYSEAAVATFIQTLQEKKFMFKDPEAPTQVSPSPTATQAPAAPQIIIPAQDQQQQIIVHHSGQVVLQPQNTVRTTILPVQQPQPQRMMQQIATIGGQKVFVNRPATPIFRSITPVGGVPTQVFQKLVPVSSSGVGMGSPKSIISVTPPVTHSQYRPALAKQVVSVASASGVSRANLPISIVSPSKPRMAQPTTPIRLTLGEPTTEGASPQASSPTSGHPGIMTSQQLTGLLQQRQGAATVSPAPATVRPTFTLSQVRPQVQAPSLVMTPRLPTILRSVTPVVSPSGAQAKTKLIAQVVNTSVGPRLMVQGLNSPKLPPAVLAQLEAQFSKQFPGGVATPFVVTSPTATPLADVSVGETAQPAGKKVVTLTPQGRKIPKPALPKIPLVTAPAPSSSSSSHAEGSGTGDIDDSIEAAITDGGDMRVGTPGNFVVGAEMKQGGNGAPVVKRARTVSREPAGQRSPSPKKRKASEHGAGGSSPQKNLPSPAHFVEIESEARFVLSQDLVPQPDNLPTVGRGMAPGDGIVGPPFPSLDEVTVPIGLMSIPPNISGPTTMATPPAPDEPEPLKLQNAIITPIRPPPPPVKVSRRKSPVRSESLQSAKATAAAQHKLMNNAYKQKELLKKDIFKRRALLEKELLVEIQAEISEELEKQEQPAAENFGEGKGPGEKSSKKRKSSETRTTTLKTSIGKASLPSGGKSSKKPKSKKKKGDVEEHCVCKRPYDRTKLYVCCDKCDKWYHGECIGITEELSHCLSDYICDPCQNIKLYCICQQAYDDTQFYIGCDKCEDWLHGRCVGVIPLEGSKLDQYVCPTCDPATPLNRVNMRALTDEDYPHLEKLIKQLLAHKSSSAFREPVDVSDAPNYFRVIKDPMDLQTIANRVDQKCYSHLREFVGDITKIFDNCRNFNPPESKYCKSANVLEVFFAQKVTLLRQQLNKT